MSQRAALSESSRTDGDIQSQFTCDGEALLCPTKSKVTGGEFETANVDSTHASEEKKENKTGAVFFASYLPRLATLNRGVP